MPVFINAYPMLKRKRSNSFDGRIAKKAVLSRNPEKATLSSTWFCGMVVKFLGEPQLSALSGVSKYLYTVSRAQETLIQIPKINARFQLHRLFDIASGSDHTLSTITQFEERWNCVFRNTFAPLLRKSGDPIYWLRYNAFTLQCLMNNRATGTRIRMDLPKNEVKWVTDKYNKEARVCDSNYIEFGRIYGHNAAQFQCDVTVSCELYQMEFGVGYVDYIGKRGPDSLDSIVWLPGCEPTKEYVNVFMMEFNRQLLIDSTVPSTEIKRAFFKSIE